MTQLYRIIVCIASYLFQSSPCNACESSCMTSPPGKFNICGGDCSLYLDCTDWVFPTDYKTCSTSLQFDENAQLCVAVSSTCPFVGVTGMQPPDSYQLAGMQPAIAPNSDPNYVVLPWTYNLQGALNPTTVSNKLTSQQKASAGASQVTAHPSTGKSSVTSQTLKPQGVLNSTTVSNIITSQQEVSGTPKVTAQPSTGKSSVTNESPSTSSNILPEAKDNEGLIVSWRYHARPSINASATVTGLPHVLACVRMCQSDPLCEGLSLEENRRPEHAQCFVYYDRWPELTFDQHLITYILK